MSNLLIPDGGAFQENATAAEYLTPGDGGISAIGTAATLEQEGYRFRNDDGSESAATWKAVQDANINLGQNQKVRLRVLINASGDPVSGQYQIEYKKSTDPDTAYKKIQ